ncbi:hypothetical protein [Advenella incenata]|uniref:hypothetical protein n=1 Tax=Advenella incenata TaxID=267800 RepID=UPI000FEC6797|nr:hypothetical protein [Advenella incenata]
MYDETDRISTYPDRIDAGVYDASLLIRDRYGTGRTGSGVNVLNSPGLCQLWKTDGGLAIPVNHPGYATIQNGALEQADAKCRRHGAPT